MSLVIEKRENPRLCILSGEIGCTKNFVRELVFSDDLCYNGMGDEDG